ncbi:MAG: hypothetical protein ACT4OM_01450 [Actinomycetota bacterium]
MNAPELIEVKLLDLPLDLHRAAREHQDGLDREFLLLSKQFDADPAGVPFRLISLSRELHQMFSSFSAGPTAELESALEQGEERIDLLFNVPPEVAPGARHLADLLNEADAYCRAGTEMLTLVAPETIVTYRNWFLEEFERQIQGMAPRPWSEMVSG